MSVEKKDGVLPSAAQIQFQVATHYSATNPVTIPLPYGRASETWVIAALTFVSIKSRT